MVTSMNVCNAPIFQQWTMSFFLVVFLRRSTLTYAMIMQVFGLLKL